MLGQQAQNENRDRNLRILLAGCGLLIGLVLIVVAFIGLGLGSLLQSQSVAQELSSTPTLLLSTPTITPTIEGTSTADITSAPIPTITPITPSTATVAPSTPTSTPPALPTATSIRSTNTPPVLKRVGNGPDLTAPFVASQQLELNALLNVGANGVPLNYPHDSARNWTGPQDLSGTAWMVWNQNYLFFVARVTDDVHVQTENGWNMYKGDSVELWLDTDLAGDFNKAQGDGDDWQFGFSPGNFKALPPEGVVYIPYRNVQLNRQLRVSTQRDGSNYIIAAQIPWSMLNLKPHGGMVLGYAVDLSDNDVVRTAQQQTQATEDPNFRFNQPLTFGNLILQ
jgi:hypothetical protein